MKVLAEISMSLDGFITGPNPGTRDPLGEGGERLHDWVTRLASWRERHGLEGGETGKEDEMFREAWNSIGLKQVPLERTRLIESEDVVHLTYRVVK